MPYATIVASCRASAASRATPAGSAVVTADLCRPFLHATIVASAVHPRLLARYLARLSSHPPCIRGISFCTRSIARPSSLPPCIRGFFFPRSSCNATIVASCRVSAAFPFRASRICRCYRGSLPAVTTLSDHRRFPAVYPRLHLVLPTYSTHGAIFRAPHTRPHDTRAPRHCSRAVRSQTRRPFTNTPTGSRRIYAIRLNAVYYRHTVRVRTLLAYAISLLYLLFFFFIIIL